MNAQLPNGERHPWMCPAVDSLSDLLLHPNVYPSGRQETLDHLLGMLDGVERVVAQTPRPEGINDKGYLAVVQRYSDILAWAKLCMLEIQPVRPDHLFSFAEVLDLAGTAMMATATRRGAGRDDFDAMDAMLRQFTPALCAMYDSAAFQHALHTDNGQEPTAAA